MAPKFTLPFFPKMDTRIGGTSNGKHEVGNKVLIDEVLIRGAAVWFGNPAFKKHILSLLLGGA
jgi:hypothetical protein